MGLQQDSVPQTRKTFFSLIRLLHYKIVTTATSGNTDHEVLVYVNDKIGFSHILGGGGRVRQEGGGITNAAKKRASLMRHSRQKKHVTESLTHSNIL